MESAVGRTAADKVDRYASTGRAIVGQNYDRSHQSPLQKNVVASGYPPKREKEGKV